jgi:hypothetical protein
MAAVPMPVAAQTRPVSVQDVPLFAQRGVR